MLWTVDGGRTLDVAVCVCTFRRPEGLRRLLDSLDRLGFEKQPRPAFGVTVVDDDPGQSGRGPAEGAGVAFPVRYVHAGRRNISAARNVALAAGTELAPLLALIDDDELPEPWWLDELLDVHRRTCAPIVTGPVLPRFDQGTPAWVPTAGAFDLGSHPDAASLKEGITGNALLDADAVVAAGIAFDERLGRSGGEDQLFFRQARARGLTIRYAARATVYETVPPERVRLGYLLRREYRKGNTLGVLARRYPEVGDRLAVRMAKAVAWAGRGAAQVVGSPLAGGRAGAAHGAMGLARAAGMVAGLRGRTYDQYADG